MAIGDIGSVIASLEFDTDWGQYSSIIHISGSVYAIAYTGPDSDGWLKTVSISDDGATLSVIASLEFDSGRGYEPDIIHISGNVYAIAYRDIDSDGQLKTVSISDDGLTIAAIASLEYETTQGASPDIIHVAGLIYAIVYKDYITVCKLQTVSISADGLTISNVASLEVDATGALPKIVHVSGLVYAVVYRGSGDDGWLKTVSISADGATLSVIASLEFDTTYAVPVIVHVSGLVYAIFYWFGTGNEGKLKTVSISNDGATLSEIDSEDVYASYDDKIIHIAENVYAYVCRDEASDGWLETYTIDNDGTIGSQIDELEFDTDQGQFPDIIHVSGNVYAIAYTGTDSDGWLKTVDIETLAAGFGRNPADVLVKNALI